MISVLKLLTVLGIVKIFLTITLWNLRGRKEKRQRRNIGSIWQTIGSFLKPVTISKLVHNGAKFKIDWRMMTDAHVLKR
uniref:At1g44910 n=1 Tax=Arabidopsis thaliana TaxID=3702 RepID=Q8H0T1_ARATH|nr:Unknown protein [Arabidopsis thaliana]AAP21305.1 At1g44910 [Arabidopsis thaliana]